MNNRILAGLLALMIAFSTLTLPTPAAARPLPDPQEPRLAPQAGGVLYVAPSGSDTGNNCQDSSAPCQSLPWAVSQAQSGDTLKLAAGTYNGSPSNTSQFMLQIDKSLTLTGGYTVTNWTVADPLANVTRLQAPGAQGILETTQPGITLTLQNLDLAFGNAFAGIFFHQGILIVDRVNATGGYPSLGIALDQAPGSRITNSRISGINGGLVGIAVTGISFDVLLEDNIVEGYNYGIDFWKSGQGVAKNNRIYNCQVGIGVSGSPGVRLEGNFVSGTTEYAALIEPYDANGEYVPSSGSVWAGNILADNLGVGLYISGTATTLENNLIVRNGGGGIHWNTNAGTGKLRHNTVADNIGAGLLVENGTLVITNTLISGHSVGIHTEGTDAQVVADHTLWFSNTLNTSGQGITTTNDVSGDPAFVGGTDAFLAYHLGETSAAVNAGADSGVGDDIDGDLRPAGAVDIGADEFMFRGTRYVAPTGNDVRNDCLNSSTPCQTVPWAVSQAQSEDIIKLAAGTYTNPEIASDGYLLTINQTLTIEGGFSTANWQTPDREANPTLLDAQSQGAALQAQAANSPRITLRNLELVHVIGKHGLDLHGVQFEAESISLQHSFPGGGDADTAAIYAEGSDLVRISDSQISAGAGSQHGIWLGAVEMVEVLTNTVQGFGCGVCLMGTGSTRVEGNLIQGNQEYGLRLLHPTYTAFISRNTIVANGQVGVEVGGESDLSALIDNNIIARNSGSGLRVKSFLQPVIIHNTIADNGEAGIQVETWTSLVNNILSGNAVGIQTQSPTANVEVYYTLWFENDLDQDTSQGGSIVTTQDVYGDPLFVGGEDAFTAFHLTPGSAAIDAGLSIGEPGDVDGELRPAEGSDIGADEFPYSLHFSPQIFQFADPGETIVFTHTLSNYGNLTNTLALSVDSAQDWVTSLEPVTITLALGQSTLVTYTLTIPANTQGRVDTLTLTAESIEAGTSISVQDSALVGLAFDLMPSSATQSAASGQTIVFTHTLTNQGVVADTYEIDVAGGMDSGWASVLDPGPFSLAPGQSVPVRVQVAVPLQAAAGTQGTSHLFVTSHTAGLRMPAGEDTTAVIARSGTRYVAPSGSDTANSCLDSAYPCAHLAQALSQALDGDTLKLSAGTYTDPEINFSGWLLQVDKNLTLAGGYSLSDWETSNPEANLTTLDAQDAGGGVYANTSGILLTLRDLTIQGINGTHNAVKVNLGRLVAENLTIIYDGTSSAITVSGGPGAEMTDSQLILSDGYGFQAASTSSTNVLRNNRIEGGRRGVDLSYSPVVFSGNLVQGTSEYGLYLNNGSGCSISGNTVTSNAGTGLFVKVYQGCTVQNNLVAGNGLIGLRWAGEYGAADLRHNTLADNGQAGLSVENIGPMMLTNNIISGHPYGIQIIHKLAVVSADHTLWYGNGFNSLGIDGRVVPSTNDISGDPAFQGGANAFSAYHLTSTSAALDAAIGSDPSNDIDGQPRLSGVADIGADEHAYLRLTLPGSHMTEAGQTLQWTHTLRNPGALPANVGLAVTSEKGWVTSVQPGSALLNSGQAISVTVSLEVPIGALGQVDHVSITATPAEAAVVPARVDDTVLVGLGASLLPAQAAQTALPGETLVYTYTLTNLGALVDTYSFSLTSSQGWASLLDQAPVSLEPGAAADVRVRVLVPALAPVDWVENSRIEVRSQQGNGEVVARAYIQTTTLPASGVRYMLPAGSDIANNCTDSSQPCASLEWAARQAQPDDTVKLGAGIYASPHGAVTGWLLIVEKNLIIEGGYSASNWDVPDPANISLLDGQTRGALRAVTPNTSLTLRNLSIQGNTDSDIGLVEVANAALHIELVSLTQAGAGAGVNLKNVKASEVLHCHLLGTLEGNFQETGIAAVSGRDVLWVEGNTIQGFYKGILVNDQHNVTLKANSIQARGRGIDFNRCDYCSVIGNGIQGGVVGMYLDYSFKALVEGNIIQGTSENALVFRHRSGRIDGNIITDNLGSGMWVNQSVATLDNNLVARNRFIGIGISQSQGAMGSVALSNNTIADNGREGIVINDATVILTNTVITGHTNRSGIDVMGFFSTVQANHTLWFNNRNNITVSDDGEVSTSGDLTGNPRFVGGNDSFTAYHILADSPAVDSGVDSGVVNDIDDQPRPFGSGYDIGSDEYVMLLPAPTAVMISGPQVGLIQQAYEFTASISPSLVSLPVTYTWQIAEQSDIMHISGLTDTQTLQFPTAGMQVVQVAVTNGLGSPVTDTFTITTYLPVEASFNTSPLTGSHPLTVTFTNTSSGPVESYLWSFGDDDTSDAPNPSHVFSQPGTYPVTLNVIGPGNQDQAVLEIVVSNDAPSLMADTATTAEDQAVAVLVLANDSDPNGDLLEISAITQPVHGNVTFTTTGVTYTPAPNYYGPDSFVYTVTDAHGATASATVDVTVSSVNDNPTAADDSFTVLEDSAATLLDVLANDSIAPDTGETLSVTAVSTATHGTLTFSADGVSYTPATDYFGPDSFTYTISDGNGGSDTGIVSLLVTPVNDNPLAVDDSAVVAEDSPANQIPVLANDNLGQDEGETLSISAVIQPLHGSVTFTETGVTYTPAADYFGEDTFIYTIIDGNGGTDSAAVNITVTPVNDNPLAMNDALTVAENSTNNTLDVLANDSIAPDTGETLTVTAVTQGEHGSVTFSATSVGYTPALDYAGPDSFTYTISDGNGGTAMATVAVTVTEIAETYSISGQVLDLNGEPFAGVVIELSTGQRVTTDEHGTYTLPDLLAGSYVLTPTLAGQPFLPLTRSLTLTGSTTGQDFVFQGVHIVLEAGEPGSLSYRDAYSNTTTVEVPAGAITRALTLVYLPVEGAQQDPDLQFADHAFDLLLIDPEEKPVEGVAFDPALRIRVNYRDEDIAGVNEAELSLRTWDGSAWEEAACGDYERDLDHNQLAVPVCHLSRFALFGPVLPVEEQPSLFLPLMMR